MAECKCTMSISILGDGCEVCNPAQALEYAKERLTDLEANGLAQALRIVELERQCKEWERRTWEALDKLHTAIDVKIGARCLHGVWIADHCWTCGEPKSVSLMER